MTAADPGFAPAKVNLFLHLRGQRADGYHLLDSLVVFAGVGDRVAAKPGDELSLQIDGPFADGLGPDGNLCIDAARALARYHGRQPAATLSLTKHLPVASGIGGGSSDAAATLRVLSRLWDVAIPEGIAIGLGADVPVCLSAPAPRMMAGIGEILGPAPPLPNCWMVLVNPGVGVATGAVFAALDRRDLPPGPELPAGGVTGFPDLCDWLSVQRNDLEAPARALCEPIGEVLDALGEAPLARMSGSGATCFALCPDERTATELAGRVARQPGWWVAAAPVLSGP